MSVQLSLGEIVALPPSAVDEWTIFWTAYPRKVGKGAARRAFLSARRRASFGAIIDGLAAYRFRDDKAWMPHASTWLNGDRWADERTQDPALDRWGLTAWYERQPEEPNALFSVRGWSIEALADVLLAAGFDLVWRGDLDTLGAWLAAGYRPDSLAETIAEAAAGAAGAPRSLRWFDRAVRQRALRWHAIRSEWVRG